MTTDRTTPADRASRLERLVMALTDALRREPRYSQDERVVSLADLCEAIQTIRGMDDVMAKAIHRAELGLGLAGMVIAERDDLSAAFELGRHAGLDEAAMGHNVELTGAAPKGD